MPKRKAVDDDNPEWTKADFARSKPGREVLPAGVVANLGKRRPGQRGPGKRPPKISITFRLDPDVVETIRSMGEGYGTRVNDTLRKVFNPLRKSTRQQIAAVTKVYARGRGSGASRRGKK